MIIFAAMVFACDEGRPQHAAADHPVLKRARPEVFKQVVVGNTQACALREDGSVKCWGATEEEIEIGTLDIYYHDGDSPAGSYERLHISGMSRSGHPTNSASGRVCAIERGALTICCWGRLDFSRRGDDECAPMLTTSASQPFIEVVNGETKVCGLTSDGNLRCLDDHLMEYSVPNIVNISGTGYSVCALLQDATYDSAILSYGACTESGMIGDATSALPKGLNNPSLVDGSPGCFWQSDPGIIRCSDSRGDWDPGPGMVGAAGTYFTTCAIYESGVVRCETPYYDTTVSDLTSDWPDDPVGQFKQLALWPDSASVGCGVTIDGEISCWGSPTGQARRIVSDAP
ncbi:MAG TPA: hypothetical protein DCQ04_01500 [Actinobacteria bacterium]|nr:hypothetical protein [Actinomycetota bacterium]